MRSGSEVRIGIANDLLFLNGAFRHRALSCLPQVKETALFSMRSEVRQIEQELLSPLPCGEDSEEGRWSGMRKCVICGGTKGNGNEVIYDYCQDCLSTDVETLHRRHMIEEEKEASRNPEKDRQEANK